MKIEIREAKIDPPKEVIITLNLEDAREIHNRLYALLVGGAANDPRNKLVRDLVDALTNNHVQLAR